LDFVAANVRRRNRKSELVEDNYRHFFNKTEALMLRAVALYVFLVVGVVIGLGAFGHGYSVHKVHEALDQFPIDSAMSATLYIVWYFVSGAMLVFGGTLIWIWLQLRAGETRSLFPALVIAALYVVTGVSAVLARPGDRFWLVFIILGILLLGSASILRATSSAVSAAR
jgi:hypothetical protein